MGFCGIGIGFFFFFLMGGKCLLVVLLVENGVDLFAWGEGEKERCMRGIYGFGKGGGILKAERG